MASTRVVFHCCFAKRTASIEKLASLSFSQAGLLLLPETKSLKLLQTHPLSLICVTALQDEVYQILILEIREMVLIELFLLNHLQ